MSEETLEVPEVEGAENNSASESAIDNLDDALKALDKARKEAASRRVKNRDLEEKAQKWEEHLSAQKTELEKLADHNSELAKTNEQLSKRLVREKVARELLDPEDEEFLVGDTEDELRSKVKKLNERRQKSTDVFAGRRGNPVAAAPGDPVQSWFHQLWNEADSNQDF